MSRGGQVGKSGFNECMLATYRSYLDRLWGCMLAGPPLGLCVGDLQVLWLLNQLLGLYVGNL